MSSRVNRTPRWVTDALEHFGSEADPIRDALADHGWLLGGTSAATIEELLPGGHAGKNGEEMISAHEQRVRFFRIVVRVAISFPPAAGHAAELEPKARRDLQELAEYRKAIAGAAEALAKLVAHHDHVANRLGLADQIDCNAISLLAEICNQHLPLAQGLPDNSSFYEISNAFLELRVKSASSYDALTLPMLLREVSHRFEHPSEYLLLPPVLHAAQTRSRGIGDFLVALDGELNANCFGNDGFLPGKFALPSSAMTNLACAVFGLEAMDPATVERARQRRGVNVPNSLDNYLGSIGHEKK